MEFRIGQGYDVHQIRKGLRMVLGGVEVPGDCGFVAHSDGDVAIHALCDALLGAVAMGDIGQHFPDTSDEWKGIDSKILLRKVVDLLQRAGWTIGNVDITIALQAPKIGSLVPSMRYALAEAMGIGEEKVSIKATTTEHLGFVGRGEGCEAWAVVIVNKKQTK